jgi:hypothetical protein
MQAPPYAEPPKKNNSTMIILIVVGAIAVGGCAVIAIGAAILFPVFSQARLAAKDTQSMSNLKQIGTALQIYASETDGRLPNATRWQEDLIDARLVRDATIFEDPILGVGGGRVHGYAMNLAANGVNIFALSSPDRSVVTFTSKVLAADAAGAEGSVRLTPRGKALIGFADGSCRATPPEDVRSLFWKLQ